jgi:hypothetical protein
MKKVVLENFYIYPIDYRKRNRYAVPENLEADAHSVITGMVPNDYQELLQRPLVEVVPILKPYHMSFYFLLIPQLQLCHLK